MTKTLVRIAPLPAAKLAAVFYLLITAPIALLVAVLAMTRGTHGGPPALLILLAPLLYAVFGFLFALVAAWLYNVVAGWVGGLEFSTETQEAPAS
jgi:hypothetical protein